MIALSPFVLKTLFPKIDLADRKMSCHSVTRTVYYLNFFFLIRQRTVGSVVTQSHDNDDSDVDEDEPNNEVFGVATVIKLAKDHVIFILLSSVPRRDAYIFV